MDANNQPLGMSGFYPAAFSNQYNPVTQTSSSSLGTFNYSMSGASNTQPSFISGGFQTGAYDGSASYQTGSYDAAPVSSTWSPLAPQDVAQSNRGHRGFGRGGSGGRSFVKKPPKEQQLFYCEVCRISCAGAQPYQEHLIGQKHKKKEAKEAVSKSSDGSSLSSTARNNPLYCEVCDVACSAAEIYASHVRGAKHLRAVNLYTMLGKPIPEKKDLPAVAVVTAPPAQRKPSASAAKQGTPAAAAAAAADTNGDNLAPKDATIVGADYLEEIRNEKGNVVSYTCKLCECSFTDHGARNMHLKGRRHQIAYKKKVDASYRVDVKISNSHQRRQQEDRSRLRSNREDFWRAEADHGQRRYEMEMARGADFGPWPVGGFMPPPMNFNPPPVPMRRRNTLEDVYMTNKQKAIYPNENELTAIHAIVTSCEKALRLVSDLITDENIAKAGGAAVKTETGDTTAPVVDHESMIAVRGAMRVGTLSKGLILSGDNMVHLVVLCAEKPTVILLKRVAGFLPGQLEVVSPDKKYVVEMVVDEAGIIVTSEDPESNISLTMTLTSPVIREEQEENATVTVDPPDMLNKAKTLEALAELRHAKWFQIRASRLRSCVMVIRILRDLRRRVPTWTVLSEWTQELLVEKCICFTGVDIGPGEALRSVFECIASGLLLPDGPGLYDPCEKEPTDVLGNLTIQQREDVTTVAQMAMRLVIFRQIHKVLDMEQMPKRTYPNRPPNKRRMSSSQELSETGGEDKKMKEEQGEGSKTE